MGLLKKAIILTVLQAKKGRLVNQFILKLKLMVMMLRLNNLIIPICRKEIRKTNLRLSCLQCQTYHQHIMNLIKQEAKKTIITKLQFVANLEIGMMPQLKGLKLLLNIRTKHHTKICPRFNNSEKPKDLIDSKHPMKKCTDYMNKINTKTRDKIKLIF